MVLKYLLGFLVIMHIFGSNQIDYIINHFIEYFMFVVDFVLIFDFVDLMHIITYQFSFNFRG